MATSTTSNVKLGIVGILSVLLASAGTLILTPDQLDHTYVCSVSEKVALFDRLSSTGKTGYWTDAEGSHSSTCTNGVWILLKTYAKDKNIDVNQFLESQSKPSEVFTAPSKVISCWEGYKGKQFSCDPEKCVEVC